MNELFPMFSDSPDFIEWEKKEYFVLERITEGKLLEDVTEFFDFMKLHIRKE
ncbi:hypothetical protein [Bacillus sp. CHD6a]|uniref:hypothetical protein n=1 Tax=Bacillus sp. CHD6a TaxID=1643452 RepID=UPI000A71F534|nr:hypothetical protein [Bacillus sp. CHD6a]